MTDLEVEPLEDSRRVGAFVPDTDPVKAEARKQAFRDGVADIRAGGTLALGEKVLLIVGGVIAPLGLVVVLLGWYGAARTPNSFEQIPYLISGGLFGLGLVFLGSFFYFAHWLTEIVKEGRTHSAALLEAIGRLHDQIESDTGPRPVVITEVEGPATDLVATARGTMAHRRDCTVVANKEGLRPVIAEDGFAACKLCDPYT